MDDVNLERWNKKVQNVKCSLCDFVLQITNNDFIQQKKDKEEFICGGCGYEHFQNDIQNIMDEFHFWDKGFKKIEAIESVKESYSKNIPGFHDPLDLAQQFVKKQPLFYDKAGLWWLWDFVSSSYIMVDETDLMNEIDKAIPYYDTVKAKVKAEILESHKRVGRKNIPKEAPVRWVQFKDKAVSLRSKRIYDVTSDYFFTNPIPWEIGESSETPNMDRIFEEWVGKEYVKTLYEIIAYCCLPDYPISRIFCLIGSGRNGKTKFLNIIERLIGDTNKCSTELDDLLDSRFEKAKLYRKLVCFMGETNFKLLEKTSILKKLCGGDLIGFEFKNKTPFDARNYAKILISTNSLPATTDKTDGFYRRWLIVDFNNQFNEDKDILNDIPDKEYPNLCKKITEMLPVIVADRKFTNEGTYEERMKRYEEKSNPLSLFIKKNCEEGVNNEVPFFEFFDEYVPFLIQNGFRKQSKPEVGKALRNEGYDIEAKTVAGKTWKFVLGLKITQITQIIESPLNSPMHNLGKNTVISVISVISRLATHHKNKIPYHTVLDKCEKDGINNIDIEIDKLKEAGTIMENPSGYLMMVR